MTGRRHMGKLALLLVAGVLGALYLSGGSTLQDSVTAPDRWQRVEFYSLTRWQRMIRLSAAVDDQIAALRDLRSGDILGRSGVFYANGIGRVNWTSTQVDIGAAGTFDRRTGQWMQGEGAD